MFSVAFTKAGRRLESFLNEVHPPPDFVF